MNALMEHSAGTCSDFWTDHRRCYTIVLLQDRVSEVGEFIECCRSALAMVYNTMFPRNPQPEGLAGLMEKFKHVEDIHRFIRNQLVAGAKVALSWVHVHHPRIDLEAVSQGLPARRGGTRISMDCHYAVARTPAMRIIRQMLDEDAEFFTNFVV